jgi:hypothetical protein
VALAGIAVAVVTAGAGAAAGIGVALTSTGAAYWLASARCSVVLQAGNDARLIANGNKSPVVLCIALSLTCRIQFGCCCRCSGWRCSG